MVYNKFAKLVNVVLMFGVVFYSIGCAHIHVDGDEETLEHQEEKEIRPVKTPFKRTF